MHLTTNFLAETEIVLHGAYQISKLQTLIACILACTTPEVNMKRQKAQEGA